MEMILSVCMGLGLSAACGFRVFVPMLVLSLAGQSGHVHLSEGFLWLATPTATITLAVATVLEIGAYYVPWLDHVLDVVSAPAAVLAGILATGAMIQDASPLFTWTMAAIAGGGSAAVIHVGTGLVRSASLLTTGGLGNPIVSTAEWFFAGLTALLALLLPFLALAMVVAMFYLCYRLYCKARRPKLAT